MSLTDNPLRGILYARNSSAKEQSIESQLDDGRRRAPGLGIAILDELSDPIGASRFSAGERKNWAKIRALLPQRDVLMVREVSRATRQMTEFSMLLDECRTNRVRIFHMARDRFYDPADKYDYDALIDEAKRAVFEAHQISDRVRPEMAKVWARGQAVGRTAYGYVRRYAEGGAKRAYVDSLEHPQQGRVVRQIFAAVAEGQSLYAIAQRLTNDRVPTSRGAQHWRPNVVRDIALSPCYRPHPDDPTRGCLVVNGSTFVASWPPLTDETTWQTVQRILGAEDRTVRRARKDSAPGQIRHLLSSSAQLLTAPCGSRVTAHADRPGRAGYYQCADDGCVSAPMAESDEYVTRLVVARLSRKDARHLWVADDSTTRAAADELARLRADLAANEASYRTGEISAKLAGARERELEPLIADAERRAQPAGVPLAALKLLDAAKISKDRVRPTWDLLPVTAQRDIIAGMFASLVLGPLTERITRFTLPEERLAIVADRISHEWRRP